MNIEDEGIEVLNNFAVIFPGQGSQFLGMLSQLSSVYPGIIDTFAEASLVAEKDLWSLVQQGPAELLNMTAVTQPVMLAADIALWRLWQNHTEIVPHYVAGHSLGEYAALVAAEVISFTDAMQLVCLRGQLMQAAMSGHDGGMAAIIGLESHEVERLCEQVSGEYFVTPANYNSNKQTVIAGHLIAVNKAIMLAKEQGAKLAKLLPVTVASHCKLMSSAEDQLAEKLATVHFNTPKINLLHNVDVSQQTQNDLIKQRLLQQMTAPVQWVRTIQTMFNAGVTCMLECGPGAVLAGLNKRIERSITTLNCDTLPHFDEATNFIKEWVE